MSSRNLGVKGQGQPSSVSPRFFGPGKDSGPSADTEIEQLSAPGELVVVRCPGFRCLAYRDPDGGWREASNKNQLPEVLEILYRVFDLDGSRYSVFDGKPSTRLPSRSDEKRRGAQPSSTTPRIPY